ncbi:MAG: hypothetical protein WBD75_08070 [Phycisphaerae bacterium]
MMPFMVFLEEYHLLSADPARADIGKPTLCTQVATAGKRNIRFVFSNQLFNFPDEILGNLGCRIVMRLLNPRCLWVAQRSMGLTAEHAVHLPELGFREAVVQYGDYPAPFKVRVDELSFPPPPDDAALEESAQNFLASVRWAEEAVVHEPSKALSLSGDALKVFMRLAEHPDELIPERCDALGMDRAREVRARKIVESKGFAVALEETLGKRIKFYQLTDKGVAWAREHNIKVKEYKSGPLHEYLLNQIEKAIGTVSPKLSFQRNSPIAREHGLEPDSVLHLPGGQRVIIEVCCNNLDYDARNIVREMQIDGVDYVLAIAANQRLKKSLSEAVERHREANDAPMAPFVLLDAGECLSTTFDWANVLKRPIRRR